MCGSARARLQNVSGVLADDMGLGKTVQTIAFFAMLRRNALGKRARKRGGGGGGSGMPPMHLVVVPASVLSNWEGELERFAPHLEVAKYHGPLEARAEAKRRVRAAATRRAPVDVVLTTYTYFERESSGDDRKFFRSLDLDYLVLDEAHGVKNMKTSRWQNLKALKTRHRLLLSGTPVQNNLRELLVLLDFLSPHVFRFKGGGHGGGWGDEGRSDPIGELLSGLGLSEDGKASGDPAAMAAVRQVTRRRGGETAGTGSGA